MKLKLFAFATLFMLAGSATAIGLTYGVDADLGGLGSEADSGQQVISMASVDDCYSAEPTPPSADPACIASEARAAVEGAAFACPNHDAVDGEGELRWYAEWATGFDNEPEDGDPVFMAMCTLAFTHIDGAMDGNTDTVRAGPDSDDDGASDYLVFTKELYAGHEECEYKRPTAGADGNVGEECVGSQDPITQDIFFQLDYFDNSHDAPAPSGSADSRHVMVYDAATFYRNGAVHRTVADGVGYVSLDEGVLTVSTARGDIVTVDAGAVRVTVNGDYADADDQEASIQGAEANAGGASYGDTIIDLNPDSGAALFINTGAGVQTRGSDQYPDDTGYDLNNIHIWGPDQSEPRHHLVQDTDNDGDADFTEIVICGSNPLNINAHCDDIDGDGLGNGPDGDPNPRGRPDADFDGVYDVEDNCVNTANPDQDDNDGDLIGDACDADADGDGLDDATEDHCPNGDVFVSDASTDHDGDGCRDTDNSDDDDNEDTDDDNDGKPDLNGDGDPLDKCPKGDLGWTSNSDTDHDNDGCRDAGEDLDDDNDGKTGADDHCPKGMVGASKPANDADGDGCKNAEDDNDDNDAHLDDDDNCPTIPNDDQADTTEMEYNPDQYPSQGDGVGDACDDDKDGDGAPVEHTPSKIGGMVGHPRNTGEDCDDTDPNQGAPATSTQLCAGEKIAADNQAAAMEQVAAVEEVAAGVEECAGQGTECPVVSTAIEAAEGGVGLILELPGEILGLVPTVPNYDPVKVLTDPSCDVVSGAGCGSGDPENPEEPGNPMGDFDQNDNRQFDVVERLLAYYENDPEAGEFKVTVRNFDGKIGGAPGEAHTVTLLTSTPDSTEYETILRLDDHATGESTCYDHGPATGPYAPVPVQAFYVTDCNGASGTTVDYYVTYSAMGGENYFTVYNGEDQVQHMQIVVDEDNLLMSRIIIDPAAGPLGPEVMLYDQLPSQIRDNDENQDGVPDTVTVPGNDAQKVPDSAPAGGGTEVVPAREGEERDVPQPGPQGFPDSDSIMETINGARDTLCGTPESAEAKAFCNDPNQGTLAAFVAAAQATVCGEAEEEATGATDCALIDGYAATLLQTACGDDFAHGSEPTSCTKPKDTACGESEEGANGATGCALADGVIDSAVLAACGDGFDGADPETCEPPVTQEDIVAGAKLVYAAACGNEDADPTTCDKVVAAGDAVDGAYQEACGSADQATCAQQKIDFIRDTIAPGECRTAGPLSVCGQTGGSVKVNIGPFTVTLPPEQ